MKVCFGREFENAKILPHGLKACLLLGVWVRQWVRDRLTVRLSRRMWKRVHHSCCVYSGRHRGGSATVEWEQTTELHLWPISAANWTLFFFFLLETVAVLCWPHGTSCNCVNHAGPHHVFFNSSQIHSFGVLSSCQESSNVIGMVTYFVIRSVQFQKALDSLMSWGESRCLHIISVKWNVVSFCKVVQMFWQLNVVMKCFQIFIESQLKEV